MTTPTTELQPIDMVLHCPACGLQHIDGVEEPPMAMPGSAAEGSAGWVNPPHRSHLCHGCGHIWRPADVPTNGVAAVKTKGKADSPVANPSPAPVGAQEREAWKPELSMSMFASTADLEAARSAAQGAVQVPAGWKLVPVVPTPDMRVAGREAVKNMKTVIDHPRRLGNGVTLERKADAWDKAKAAWSAMLAAAPAHAGERQGDSA